ncbi:nuclease-related domain-containing protein [Salicibibacter halophilus]|uniref:nuclease-related domain-containing protein n=1 Tax=Salicibibacter halophilus TaxID=2502791 RepID=UPI0013571AC7|nr:nuclease-related domain-containing protein [Salicibibacter halophilus]
MNLEKGYAGELKLDVWLEGLRNDCLVVNDLLLTHKGKVFQIDSLVIFQSMIYLFDSKYHKGNFYLDGNKWNTLADDEINSPLPQMERCESLLRQLLRQCLNTNLPIEAFLVFTHPEFTLYHASPKLPAIFPTQLHSFMKKMNKLDSKLNRSHEKLAEQLVAQHLNKSPNTQWPEYDFGHLKKGVVCSKCSSFMIERGRIWMCAACGQTENAQAAILRSIQEFKILFPKEKITSNKMRKWCAVEGDRKKVYRTLTNHFKKVGSRSASYYID